MRIALNVVRKLKMKKIKKMKKSIVILIMVTAGFFSSGQSSKSTTNSIYTGTLDSTKNVQSQKSLTNDNQIKFNTKYEYTESNGARLIIQNSFPKSTINYTVPDGKKYIYAAFWTRITNETFNIFFIVLTVRKSLVGKLI